MLEELSGFAFGGQPAYTPGAAWAGDELGPKITYGLGAVSWVSSTCQPRP